jgi:pilus assembly protein FimV
LFRKKVAALMRFSTVKLFMLMLLGASLLLFPADGLRALGLGEARVDSYLGQPLDISIRLIEADASALDSLTAAPASSRDYERLGVPTDALALGLEVTVDRRVDPPLLRVRSRRAVSDPILQFMIDARWSTGRVLREYTVFLDPPTFEVSPPITRREEPAPEVEPAPEPRPAERPRPAAERPSEPAPPVAERAPSPAPGVVGPITAGQTLWGVAYAWRPDTSLTMNQVMLAILDKNPQAFVDNNVNRLRRGAELSMPDIEEVRRLSATEADRRIRSQMQAWQQDTGRRDVPVIAEDAVPEVERAPETRAEPTEPEVVHRLEVVPPDSDIFDEGPAVSDGEVQRASSRLAELEDRMYAEELDNDELYRQVESIREAIESREAAGLAVADEEMAQFEARLREAREARDEAQRLAAETELPEDDEVSAYFRELEEELALIDQDRELPVDEDSVRDADVATETDEAVIAEPEPAVSEPETMPVASMDEGRGLPVWLGAIALLVILAAIVLAFLWLRRRGSADSSTGLGAGRADVPTLRTRIKSSPSNLAAHLALLQALADRDDTKGFSDALDDMYRQVNDEEDRHWQEALNLAVACAPDHPMLTPNETRFATDDDDELDDRTREMLGILGSDQPSEAEETATTDDDDFGSEDDLGEDDRTADDQEFFGVEEEEAGVPPGEPSSKPVDDGDDDIDEFDLDLAAVSNRLNEDDETDVDTEAESDDLDLDLDIDEESDDSGLSAEEPSLEPDDIDDDEFDELSLDESGPASLDEEDAGAIDSDNETKDELNLDFAFDESDKHSEAVSADAAESGSDLDAELSESNEDLDLAVHDDESLAEKSDESTSSPEDLDSRGEREFEAFLHGGGDEADEEAQEPGDSRDEAPAAREAADSARDDTAPGEATLSDDDAEVKLDLARAYISMDDPDSARTLLEEITSGGSAAMREQAREMLDGL